MDAAALLCSICPKRPTFSDASHLLTHISSKAHLSNYFKLQIRSHQEPQAGQLLDEYDLWYKANNLPKLLSDRMASKEARKRKSQGKGDRDLQATKTVKARTTASSKKPDSSPRSSLSTVLDPRLSNPFTDVDDSVENGSSTFYTSYVPPTTRSTTRASHAHPTDCLLPVTPPRPIPMPWKQECESEPDDDTSTFLQSIPVWGSRFHDSMDTSFSLLQRAASYDPFVEDDSSFDYPRTSEKEKTDEMARLKGVLWPGMDIFDSATEQMRRKRNQKKDESVLRRMEETSMGVEPTELIFSPTGILRKQRVISGNAEDDGSPLPGEIPIPKRIPRPKRVLSEADPNAHLVQNKKRARKSTGQGYNKESREQTRPTTRTLRSTTRRFIMFRGDDHCPSRGGDGGDDFDLTLRGLGPRPRSGFSVFLDEPSNYDTDLRELDQPDRPQPEIPVVSRGNALHSDTLQPTTGTYDMNLMKRPDSASTDKGDIGPILDVHERLEPSFDWDSPVSKQYYASDAGVSPQYFFGDAPRVELNLFDNRHGTPATLTALLPKMPDDDRIYPMCPRSTSHRDTSVFRDLSPDATISEMGDDEFERFCLNGNLLYC